MITIVNGLPRDSYYSEWAKQQIFSELDIIKKWNPNISNKEIVNSFLEDWGDCDHVGEYKLRFSKEWLYDRLK